MKVHVQLTPFPSWTNIPNNVHTHIKTKGPSLYLSKVTMCTTSGEGCGGRLSGAEGVGDLVWQIHHNINSKTSTPCFPTIPLTAWDGH